MAETASPIALALNVTQDVELSAVADTLKRVDVPANARWLKITARATDGKLVRGGTGDAAIGTTAYETLFADSVNTIRVPGSGDGRGRNVDTAAAAANTRRVCLAGGASLVLEITALP